jgi:hypothetical protein
LSSARSRQGFIIHDDLLQTKTEDSEFLEAAWERKQGSKGAGEKGSVV